MLPYDFAILKLERELEDVCKHIRSITVELDTIFKWKFYIRNREIIIQIPEDGVSVPSIYIDHSWQKENHMHIFSFILSYSSKQQMMFFL